MFLFPTFFDKSVKYFVPASRLGCLGYFFLLFLYSTIVEQPIFLCQY